MLRNTGFGQACRTFIVCVQGQHLVCSPSEAFLRVFGHVTARVEAVILWRSFASLNTLRSFSFKPFQGFIWGAETFQTICLRFKLLAKGHIAFDYIRKVYLYIFHNITKTTCRGDSLFGFNMGKKYCNQIFCFFNIYISDNMPR